MRGPISVKPFARKWRASNWVLISLHSNILTLAPIRCFIIIVCLERTTKNSASQLTGGYLSSFPKERKSHENFLQFTRPEKLRALAPLFRCSFRKWQEEAWRDATRLAATRSHCFCCLIIARWFLISPGYRQEIMGRHYDKMTCCIFGVSELFQGIWLLTSKSFVRQILRMLFLDSGNSITRLWDIC